MDEINQGLSWAVCMGRAGPDRSENYDGPGRARPDRAEIFEKLMGRAGSGCEKLKM